MIAAWTGRSKTSAICNSRIHHHRVARPREPSGAQTASSWARRRPAGVGCLLMDKLQDVRLSPLQCTGGADRACWYARSGPGARPARRVRVADDVSRLVFGQPRRAGPRNRAGSSGRSGGGPAVAPRLPQLQQRLHPSLHASPPRAAGAGSGRRVAVGGGAGPCGTDGLRLNESRSFGTFAIRSVRWQQRHASRMSRYGAVASCVCGTGEVRYKDVPLRSQFVRPPKRSPARYTMQQQQPLRGFGASSAPRSDDSRIWRPVLYLGRAFTERKLYREGRVTTCGRVRSHM